MAITSGSDISVVLSGGTVNLDPNNSLGGEPSNAPITDGVLNNLFDDISPEESDIGHEDYRCIYFFNDGETAIYSIEIFIASDFIGGATIEIGIRERNEAQRIFITDGVNITSGSMTLSYAGITFVSSYEADLGDWSTTLRNTLLALVDLGGDSLLTDVTVSAQTTGDDIIFDIFFTDDDGKRNHDQITYVSDDFSPAVSITTSTPQEGAPINTIAPDIGLETTPPGGVAFFAPSELSPIRLPVLKPEDGFPLWVKRVVDPNTEAVADDGFKLRFTGEALPPSE